MHKNLPYYTEQWVDEEKTEHRGFSIKDKEDSVDATFHFKKLALNKVEISISIVRSDYKKQRRVFPSGIGISLYKKMLSHIQYLATSLNKTYVHKLIMAAHDESEEGVETWHRRFDPIIQEYGYKKLNETEWQKTYEPQI